MILKFMYFVFPLLSLVWKKETYSEIRNVIFHFLIFCYNRFGVTAQKKNRCSRNSDSPCFAVTQPLVGSSGMSTRAQGQRPRVNRDLRQAEHPSVAFALVFCVTQPGQGVGPEEVGGATAGPVVVGLPGRRLGSGKLGRVDEGGGSDG